MLGILGHAFLCTFLTFKVTINCVRADTTASILITSLHKTPESIQSHTLASKTRVIVFLHGEGVVELETSTIFKNHMKTDGYLRITCSHSLNPTSR